jgi:perosamine synthetase
MSTSNLTSQVVQALRSVVGQKPVGLHEPTFSGNEWEYLKDCLDSTFVSSVGRYVDRFEVELARHCAAGYAVAVVNGTAALHVALKLAGVMAGDEVLIPALTFVATANAVSYCGATPHFVDSETTTLGIDAIKLRGYLHQISDVSSGQCINRQTGKVIRAVVPMHTFGHPVNLDELLSVAREFNIVMIEDAAESLGSYYKGRHTGTFGAIGTLSFNGNKTITTGGGGALLIDDPDVAKRAKHITTTAKQPHAWEYRHDEIGFNYRMPNINAALGCAQLEQLPGMLESKRRLYGLYRDAFEGIEGVELMCEPPHSRSNYWLQTLVLHPEVAECRDELLRSTNDAGIMTRPVWTLMHKLPQFSRCPRMDLSCAESLSARVINIPSSSHLATSSA